MSNITFQHYTVVSTPNARVIFWSEEGFTDVQVYIREPGCVIYYPTSYIGGDERQTFEELCDKARRWGTRSQRPFQLTQPADFSCKHCAISLLLDLCEHRGGDARYLLTRARARNIPFLFDSAEADQEQATWESTPTRGLRWASEDIENLHAALLKIRYSFLLLAALE